MKRITALLICAMMVFCLLPATAMAADTWDGTSVDTSWYDADPGATAFTINTAAQLAGLAQIVNGGGALIDDPVVDDDYHYNFRGVTITLGGDIDLGGHQWTPIGYFDPTGIGGWQLFAGTFDGGGHTVSGLAIGTASSPETSLYMAGLFAETYTGSCLENLNVESTGIYSLYSEGSEYGAYVGVLAAAAYGRVSNCTAAGDVTGGDAATVGGLAGSSGGDMTNCHASGNVVGGVGSSAGGLLGNKAGGALTGCYATGNVTGGDYAGGLVGNGGMGTISNCFATGNVTGNGDYVGGFIGYFDNNTSVSGCYAAGNVTGNGYYAGGFVGFCFGSTLDSCFATGDVQLSDGGDVGGFIGSNGGYATGSVITRCYAFGNVTNTGNNVEVGGFAGYNNHVIEDCYAAGSVSGGNHSDCLIGGFIGDNDKDIQSSYARGAVSGSGTGTHIGGFAGWNGSGATLGNCYFDMRDSGLTAGIGQDYNSQAVTGLAPDEMTGTAASTNMAGLDFSAAWTAKANDSKWYFPQLTVFAGSSDSAVGALSLSSVTLTPFTVTFESNGGGAVASEYGYYTAVSKPADPTKANSVFQGWYDNPGFSGSPWDFSTIISADRTLYAKWADLSHTVTFQSNGGSDVQGGSAESGSHVTKPADPSKPGYAFGGWYKDNNTFAQAWNFAVDTMPGNDLILYAKWNIITYTISYDLAGGTLDSPNPASYTITSGAIMLNNPTQTGYVFAGWSGTGISGTSASVSIAQGSMGERSYTAHWAASGYTVTFNAGKGATVLRTSQSASYGQPYGDLPKPTKKSYYFMGWYTNAAFTGSPVTSATVYSTLGSTTLYAKWVKASTFALKTPSLTVKATDHRTVKLSWKAVSGADGYYVFKKIGSTYQKIATVKGTTIYTDTGLSANVKYYYKVQAFRVPYLDEVSSKASSAKYARPVWPAIRITKIWAADCDSITLTWEGTAEAAGYQVLRSTSKKSGYTVIGTCTANTYTDDTAQAGVTYYYEVKAYDAYGAYSAASAYKSARTVPGTPQT